MQHMKLNIQAVFQLLLVLASGPAIVLEIKKGWAYSVVSLRHFKKCERDGFDIPLLLFSGSGLIGLK